MQIPTNVIHFYIGFPVMIGMAIDTFRRYKKSNNITTWYIACACFTLGIAMFFYGIPALFTRNAFIISFGTYIADCLQIATFLFLWLVVIRAFLGNKPRLMALANVLVVSLTIACMANVLLINLRSPYGAKVITNLDGTIKLAYYSTPTYRILTGLDSICLLLIGVFFWRQGKQAPTPGQSIRIRALAAAFLIAAGVFVIMPTLPLNDTLQLKDILLGIMFLIIAISTIIGSLLNRRTSQSKELAE